MLEPAGAVATSQKPRLPRAGGTLSPADAISKTLSAELGARPPELDLLMEQARHRERLISTRMKVERAALSYPQRYLVSTGECERGPRGSAAEKALEKRAGELLKELAKGGGPEALTSFVSPYLASLAVLREGQKESEKTIEALAQAGALGPLSDFLEQTFGLNVLACARILGATGWLGDYRKVAGIWKRCGLGVFDGRRQQNSKEDWERQGFAPSRRGAIFASLIPLKMRGGSEEKGWANAYAPIYSIRKAMTEGRVKENGKPWTLAHRHQDALSVMAKEVLRDMALVCGCQDPKARKPCYRAQQNRADGV